MSEPQMLALPHVDVAIWHADKYVETRFRDGYKMGALREANEETMRDAADLGYERSAHGVWVSLVEHEIAHSVIAPMALHRDTSSVLRHHAGAEYTPHYMRTYEESIVLALQRFCRTRDVTTAIAYMPHVQMRQELRRYMQVALPTELAA